MSMRGSKGQFIYCTGTRGKKTRDKLCPDCGRLILRKSSRCRSCSQSGKNSPHWGERQSSATKEKRSNSLKLAYKEGRRESWNKDKPNTWNNGEKSNFWRGGVSPINKIIRGSIAYRRWRENVFGRDDYTCQICGIKGGNIQADHIKPFAYFPELRFSLSNGRTLCRNCHKETDTWGSRARRLYKSGGNAHAFQN